MNRKVNQTMFQIPAALLVQALMTKVGEAGIEKRGTYNRSDPTAFRNAECYVTHTYDQWLLNDVHLMYADGMQQGDEPPMACYKIEVRDCTWGVECTVSLASAYGMPWHATDKDSPYPASYGSHWLNFYLDNDSGEIHPRIGTTMDKVQKFLLDSLEWDTDSESFTYLSNRPFAPDDPHCEDIKVTKREDGKYLVTVTEQIEIG